MEAGEVGAMLRRDLTQHESIPPSFTPWKRTFRSQAHTHGSLIAKLFVAVFAVLFELGKECAGFLHIAIF